MPAAAVAPHAGSSSAPTSRRSSVAPEKKYKCQFCHTAFSRSEHRSRHERSHTKERPFHCHKCRSTFVRRDLLLRHDRTVHAKDGGAPLRGPVKRRATGKATPIERRAKPAVAAIDPATLEQIEASSDGLVDLETAAMLMTDLHHKATAAMSGASEPDALLDPSMSLAAGAGALPWDAFMPSARAPATAHSIASSVSGSPDTRPSPRSFTSFSTVPPPPEPPSPEMERRPVSVPAERAPPAPAPS
ncbi:MAG: hypothetical protein M1826_004641, partial [Phylliscum demangeonii]